MACVLTGMETAALPFRGPYSATMERPQRHNLSSRLPSSRNTPSQTQTKHSVKISHEIARMNADQYTHRLASSGETARLAFASGKLLCIGKDFPEVQLRWG